MELGNRPCLTVRTSQLLLTVDSIFLTVVYLCTGKSTSPSHPENAQKRSELRSEALVPRDSKTLKTLSTT